MENNKQPLRVVALVILAAVVLRIIFSCTLGDRFVLFAQPELADYLAQSDNTIPPPADDGATEQTEGDTAPIGDAVGEPLTQASAHITAEDAQYVQIKYSCSRQPDVPGLLSQSLQWDLTADEPTVLIIHTHGTEAYTPTEGMEYEENGGSFRTTDDRVNMISLGDELTRLLQASGINAIHDRSYYDYPDYEASYDNCRTALEKHMKKNPSIQLVIDLHRDAAENEDGTQWTTDSTINGEQAARVMLVMGTDSYYEHPNWEQNLSLALKIHTLMEKEHPGSTRPLDLRKQRFNQDLCPGAIIAEIGATGNTHEQAMNSVSVLAEAIIRLAHGSV